jgi:hypothetical protein
MQNKEELRQKGAGQDTDEHMFRVGKEWYIGRKISLIFTELL